MAMSAALESARIPICSYSARSTTHSTHRGTWTSATAASISILPEAKAGLASTSICGGRSLPAPSGSDRAVGMLPIQTTAILFTGLAHKHEVRSLLICSCHARGSTWSACHRVVQSHARGGCARNGRLLRYEYSNRAEHRGPAALGERHRH